MRKCCSKTVVLTCCMAAATVGVLVLSQELEYINKNLVQLYKRYSYFFIAFSVYTGIKRKAGINYLF